MPNEWRRSGPPIDDVREDAAFYAAIFDAAPGACLVLEARSPHYPIAEVNAAFLAVTMTSRDRLVGRSLFEAFPDPPDATGATGERHLRASFDRVVAIREADRMPVQRYDLRRPDGTWEERHWLATNTPVLDAGGETRWIIHHVEDVTPLTHVRNDLRDSGVRLAVALDAEQATRAELARVHALLRAHTIEIEHSNLQLQEQAVELETMVSELEVQRDIASAAWRQAEEAERRASAILESVGDAFFAVDREWRFTYVNARAEALWGVSREALLGCELWAHFPGAVGTPTHHQLTTAMGEGRPVAFEGPALAPSGWRRVHAYPSALGLSVYLTDITAEREFAAERARRAEMVVLLQRVAVAANTASTIENALNAAVEVVCETLHWPVGHAYTVHRAAPALVSSPVWRLDPPDCCAALRAASEQLPWSPRRGLVGRALEQRRSVWLAELAADPTFARGAAAAESGIVAGLAVPVLADGQVAGVLEFFCREPSAVDDKLLAVLDQVGAQMGRVIEREWAHEDRQLLLQRVVAAQEEERRRLSREVHDNFGQHLTALQLRLRTLRIAVRAATDPADGQRAEVERALAELEALGHTLHADARALAFELRPTVLDDVGLASALADHVARWSGETGIPVDLHLATLEGERFPAAVETALYRTIQEALTNVARHAGATRVSVIVRRRGSALLVVVEDDGCGFDVAGARRATDGRTRLGLVGMQERIAGAAGTLTIESTPGGGTTVFARIPLAPGDLAPAGPEPSRARAPSGAHPSPPRP